MGSNQSSCGKHDTTISPQQEKSMPSSAGGRKSIPEEAANLAQHASIEISIEDMDMKVKDTTNEELDMDMTSVTHEGYSDDDYSDDDEDDDEWEERLRILEDARNLKQLAEFFMHPEEPVKVDPAATARCYYNRYSAPDSISQEEADEDANIMEDLKSLKQLAKNYFHPELSVVTTDAAAYGSNYFTRFSAPEMRTQEESETRAYILADAKALKDLAEAFHHPELPAVTTYGAALGRNYFTRPSAPEMESQEEAEERAQILADAKALKELAVAYRHPELPVVTTDSMACGRNFFTRFSAPDMESQDEAEERAAIHADAKALKELAVAYRHPELPVATTDGAALGRNYFTRPSAPDMESQDEAEERAAILADAKALKELAVVYHHPELPVAATDGAAFGRNYFTRPSAPDMESQEETEERAAILADVKELAVAYLHPELPIVSTNATACGRNYFSRPSAPGHDEMVHTFPADLDDHSSHHEHLDHFGMDEEMDFMFEDMRQELSQPKSCLPPIKNVGSDEEEGNLSRSPSSVMLYTGEAMYD